MFRRQLFIAAAALACALPALAQGNPTGTISGQVTSQDRQALPGVTVTDRDAFRTANSTRTDISLNLSRPMGFRRSELFVRAHVVNLFDEAAVVNPSCLSTRVLSAGNSTAHQRFNPFGETPVEGVHWAKAGDFGQPTSRFAYQTPRTIRFSVGLRF